MFNFVKKFTIGFVAFVVLAFMTSPAIAGTGIYDGHYNEVESEMVDQHHDAGTIPPELKEYNWSEELGEYYPFDWNTQYDNPFPSASSEELSEFLPAPPVYEKSVRGKVLRDTLIYSGPSNSDTPYEDNGIIPAETPVVIFYEELGYYFVEIDNQTESIEDRGFLPTSEVLLDDLGSTVVRYNFTQLSAAVNKLGRTAQRQTYTVYSSMSTSSTPVGTIGGSSREIVQVNTEDSSWYNITYRTSSSTKTGYIQKSNIYIPPFTDTSGSALTKPIASGQYQWDFIPASHNGVDISQSNGVQVKAIAPGSLAYKVTFAVEGTGTTAKLHFNSYGRHAVLTSTVKVPSTGQTYTVGSTYAHLGSYSNNAYITVNVGGSQTKTFPLRYASSDLIEVGVSGGTALAVDFESPNSGIHSKTVTNGYVIGTAGQTGYTTGQHLHFEITSASSGNIDPFNYVLFWGMDYEH